MERNVTERRGITRIEVVALVVACLAVLCLFLPAASGEHREASRQTSCANNLYHLGLAAIRFSDQRDFIPGWRNASVCKEDAPGVNAVSWPVLCLPFIEEMKLFDKWRSGKPDSPFLPIFSCPSIALAKTETPILSYAGNVGSGSNNRKWDGVMLDTTDDVSGRVHFAEISQADGTANTLLIAERCGSGDTKSQRPLHQYWWDRRGLLPAGEDVGFFSNAAPNRLISPWPRPGFGIAGKPRSHMKVINNTTEDSAPGFWSQPSSQHLGGALVVFCDGHTTFVSEKIAVQVYAQLLSSDRTKASEISRVDWGAENHPVLQDSDYRR
jgi:hypothetical protein